MTGLFFHVDREVAAHAVLAIRDYRRRLAGADVWTPEQLEDLEHALLEMAQTGQSLADESSTDSSQVVTTASLAEDPSHEWFSRQDVARMTGISLSTIDRAIKAERLRSSLEGRRQVISRAALDEWLMQRQTRRRVRRGGGHGPGSVPQSTSARPAAIPDGDLLRRPGRSDHPEEED